MYEIIFLLLWCVLLQNGDWVPISEPRKLPKKKKKGIHATKKRKTVTEKNNHQNVFVCDFFCKYIYSFYILGGPRSEQRLAKAEIWADFSASRIWNW